ncbi:MAG TPA: 5-(carboxyamino)imidazole ribonucleotide synthase [Candidatus Saccharimonadia bacterium]|jgi:5-(carboxyamino)imidazole ribonucleotide synthase|nr:5-(carboxyamino)imidazole ribonucleotide synthase [Candidatus Saccharimonadia bacterium]
MMNSQQTIGIVGGGQLGRMLTLSALPLGFRVVVVDPSEDCPAAQVGAEQIKGDYYDEAALRKLAEQSDFVTIEIEHIDAKVLETLAAAGVKVNPAPPTIQMIQDKFAQKEFLAEAGVPVAPFAKLEGADDGAKLLQQFGGKMLVKTRTGAYDGRGNMVVASEQELAEALERFAGRKLYAEGFVTFEKELAIMAARGADGTVATYAVVETKHERNICVEVLAPAAVNTEVAAQAEAVAKQVAGHMQGAGVFGIEMFLTSSGKVLVNEIAPRVHNSGHWTMNGAHTSQFEQHIRAVAGLPLGDTALSVPAAAMVNILGEGNHPTKLTGLAEALAVPGVYVHLYGKTPTKVDRKMGHINAIGETVEEARDRARKARKELSI